MKKLIQIMVLGALMLFAPYSNAAITNVDKQFLKSIDVLENGGFENGKSGWTASSPATFSLITGSNALVGSTSARFNSSATAQTVCSKLYSVPKGIQGLPALGYFKYITTESTNKYKLKVLDGSSNILSTNDLDATTTANFAYAPFNAPTSGTMKLCIESTGDSADIDFDFGHFGSDTRLQDLSQAKLIGTVKVTGCASYWTVTSTSYAVFPAQTGCVYTITGTGISAPSTMIPGFTVASLPAGEYIVEYEGDLGITGTNVFGSFQTFDGTNVSREETAIKSGAGSINTTGFKHSFSYSSSQSNITFQVRAKSATNTTNLGQFQGNQVFKLYYFPSATESGVRIDQLGWHVDANISGANPDLGSAAQTSYIGIENSGLTLTNNSGNAVIAAQIPCSSTNAPTGTTCAAGNESVGVSFNVPNAGDVIACVSFARNFLGTGTANSVFQIVETPNNAQTISQEGKSRVTIHDQNTGVDNRTFGGRVCGNFTFASSGQKTLRLMYEQTTSATVTTNVIVADASASLGQRDIHWEVYPLNYQSGAMPIFKGMVTSKSSGRQRIESFTFGGASNPSACTGSPCTVYTSSAPVTVTRSGTGIYSAVFTEAFGGVINCTAMMISGASSGHFLTSGTSTTTTYGFDGRVSSSAANQDMGGSVICMGAN